MTSRESSEHGEKLASQNRKSSKCWLYNCFSQTSFSESELDSDSEYVIINHSVFKIPKNLQTVTHDRLNYSNAGTSKENTIIVQRGSEKRLSDAQKKNRKIISEKKGGTEKKLSLSEKKNELHTARSDISDKIYQYIRMKTYERMNPYEMHPNDFLNNISSVFVDNIKDQVPKDPLNRPKIFNRYGRRRKKSEVQIMYEKAKELEKGKEQHADPRPNMKYSDVQTLRKPTINYQPSDLTKSYGEESLGYKIAIEEEEKANEYPEKVLIWKIVVADEKDEPKE